MEELKRSTDDAGNEMKNFENKVDSAGNEATESSGKFDKLGSVLKGGLKAGAVAAAKCDRGSRCGDRSGHGQVF